MVSISPRAAIVGMMTDTRPGAVTRRAIRPARPPGRRRRGDPAPVERVRQGVEIGGAGGRGFAGPVRVVRLVQQQARDMADRSRALRQPQHAAVTAETGEFARAQPRRAGHPGPPDIVARKQQVRRPVRLEERAAAAGRGVAPPVVAIYKVVRRVQRGVDREFQQRVGAEPVARVEDADERRLPGHARLGGFGREFIGAVDRHPEIRIGLRAQVLERAPRRRFLPLPHPDMDVEHAMPAAVEDREGMVDLRLPDLAPERLVRRDIGRLLAKDRERALGGVAVLAADDDANRVVAGPDVARADMHREAAEQRVGPFGERGGDVFAALAVIGAPEAALVDENLDMVDSARRDRPAGDPQDRAHGIARGVSRQRGRVEVEADARRAARVPRFVLARRLLRLHRQGDRLLLAIDRAHPERQDMLALEGDAGLVREVEARLPRAGDAGEAVTDVGAREARLGLADRHAVEFDEDRGDAGFGDRPARGERLATRRQRHDVAAELRASDLRRTAGAGAAADWREDLAREAALAERLHAQHGIAADFAIDVLDELEAAIGGVGIIGMRERDVGAGQAGLRSAQRHAVEEQPQPRQRRERNRPAARAQYPRLIDPRVLDEQPRRRDRRALAAAAKRRGRRIFRRAYRHDLSRLAAIGGAHDDNELLDRLGGKA